MLLILLRHQSLSSMTDTKPFKAALIVLFVVVVVVLATRGQNSKTTILTYFVLIKLIWTTYY